MFLHSTDENNKLDLSVKFYKSPDSLQKLFLRFKNEVSWRIQRILSFHALLRKWPGFSYSVSLQHQSEPNGDCGAEVA